MPVIISRNPRYTDRQLKGSHPISGRFSPHFLVRTHFYLILAELLRLTDNCFTLCRFLIPLNCTLTDEKWVTPTDVVSIQVLSHREIQEGNGEPRREESTANLQHISEREPEDWQAHPSLPRDKCPVVKL
jgi:hypothetical protein